VPVKEKHSQTPNTFSVGRRLVRCGDCTKKRIFNFVDTGKRLLKSAGALTICLTVLAAEQWPYERGRVRFSSVVFPGLFGVNFSTVLISEFYSSFEALTVLWAAVL